MVIDQLPWRYIAKSQADTAPKQNNRQTPANMTSNISLPFLDIDALALLYASQRVTGSHIRSKQNSPAFVEVFSGNAHMARSAISAGCDPVITIDFDATHEPTMCLDVTVPEHQRQIRSAMLGLLKQGHVIAGHWSPDCSQFSVMRTSAENARDIQGGLGLLQAGLQCCQCGDTCCMAVWTLENPYHTRECSLWAHLDCRVSVVDYCTFSWEAKKPTGLAASDAVLQDVLDNSVAGRCPGPASCPQCWRDHIKHETDVQSMGAKRRKCIPPMLAHCLVMHIARRALQVAHVLAAAVDDLHTGSAQKPMPGCVVAYVPSATFASPHDIRMPEMNGQTLRVVRIDSVVTAMDEYLLANVTCMRQSQDNQDLVNHDQQRSELLAIPMKDVFMVLRCDEVLRCLLVLVPVSRLTFMFVQAGRGLHEAHETNSPASGDPSVCLSKIG